MEFNVIKFEVSEFTLLSNGTELTLLMVLVFALCFVFIHLKMHR